MDLKKFHILFITLATLCLVGFGLWCFAPRFDSPAGLIPAGIFSILLGMATAVYGMWFYRNKIRALSEVLDQQD
jgi:uncharacterized membrane protein YpjA